jgi:hypothetical protein
VFDKATCQAIAAILRKHVEIADLAKATPFDIEHGRNGDEGLRSLAVNGKRAPTERVGCSETTKLDRFWLEFSAVILWLGGAESNEGIEVFGGAEGVHSQARR